MTTKQTVNINGVDKEMKWVEKQGHWDAHWEVDGVPFDGHRTLWSFKYEPKTYLKESELSGDEWRKGGYMTIMRDGVSVFKEFCRRPERAFVVMAYILPKLQDFWWEKVKVGEKIYNHDMPATITSICEDGEIMVESESGEPFNWAHNQEEKKEDPEHYEDEWGPKDRVHVLSEHLHWFRK